MSTVHTITITLMIECSDKNLVPEVAEQFGTEHVSESSNFIGGTSIAVFLVSSIKLLQPTVKNILDFLSSKSKRFDDAHIVFDGKKLDLKGYSPEDAEKILKNPVFDKLRS